MSYASVKKELVKDVNKCFTCGSCDIECPINLRAGKLFPRNLVRLAVLGFDDDLIREKSIWFCIQCDRCVRACPMTVKPAKVIQMARRKALEERVVNYDFIKAVKKFRNQLQNARFLVARGIFLDGGENDPEKAWELAADLAIYETLVDKKAFVPANRRHFVKIASSYLDSETSLTSCWTCGACANACPVAVFSRTFSPMMVLRQANLGDRDGLFRDARLWLCVECERCIDACPQAVKGLWVIKALQDWVLNEKPEWRQKYDDWRKADLVLHGIFVESIGALP